MARRAVGNRKAAEVITISDSEDDEQPSEAQAVVSSIDKRPSRRKTRATIKPLFRSNGISVYDTDVSCLSYDQYINDTIIDFYLNVIHNECTTEQALETHIFSTHFYSALASFSRKSGNTRLDEARLRKWTKTINLFTNYIVIPINEPDHWFLSILCFPCGPVVNERDKKNAKNPCILFFDPLCPTNRDKVSTVLREFLSHEYERIYGETRVFNRESMPNHSVVVPQQNNRVDCGIFVLQFVESFLANPNIDYHQPQADWFNEIHILQKREKILKLLEERCPKDVEMPRIQLPTLNGKMVIDTRNVRRLRRRALKA